MKIFKSHFWYNKSQRNGVLFLLIFIVILQGSCFFIDFTEKGLDKINTTQIVDFERQFDSLKEEKESNRNTKIYPFNPNYITDYKGYKLGMTLNEIDRLHQFRKKNKFINSIEDFKRITKVSDRVLNKISPYFKFPDWVINKQTNKKRTSNYKKEYSSNYNALPKKIVSTNNINLAKAEDFASIKGIGKKLSERIVNYRTKLQGFSYEDQLYEVWGIEPELIKKVLMVFVLNSKPVLKKVNINTASFKEVLKTPYVDYDLCKKIFDYRDEVAELQDISELKKIEGFPLIKYERIVLYLEVN